MRSHIRMLFASSIIYLKHAVSFGDSGSPHILSIHPHLAIPVIIAPHHISELRPPFGDSGAAYILNTPLQLAILNTPPHLGFPVHRITLPHLALSVSYISSTRLLFWRFRFTVYLKHDPSFGDCGSSHISYILDTLPHLAVPNIIPVRHIS